MVTREGEQAAPDRDHAGHMHLVASRPSEAEIAKDLLARLKIAAEPLAALLDEAGRAGFLVRWNGFAPNAFGKNEVVDLRLEKHFR